MIAPPEPPVTRRSAALYRALLAALPSAFRARYGDEMAAVFRRWAEDAHARGGTRALARLWLRALADLTRSAAREHVAAVRARRTRTSPAAAEVSLHPPRVQSAAPPGDSMGSLVQDIRFAVRALRRFPAVAAVVVISLALGIGANTLIYSVVDGIIFRPFPYPEPDRLVAIGVTFPKVSGEQRFIEALSPPEFVDIGTQSRTLERVFAFDLGNRNISGGDRPERVFSAFVWGDPFVTIGMRPVLGRGFRDDETYGGSARVGIISHRIWQARFGSDSSLVGRPIQVNGEPVTIVGVMPPGLLLIGTDLWLPMGINPAVIPRQGRQFSIVARFKAGASLTQVNAELSTIASRTEQTYGREREEYAGWRLRAVPWANALVGEYRPAAWVLLGSVGFVLLIACANIASLLLARAASRHREIGVRRALGAGTTRIVRQLLTESLLLALLGAALGIGLAYGLLRPTVSLFPEQVLSTGATATLNVRVLLYSLALAIASGLIFGLAPAIQGARGNARAWLSSEGTRLTIGAGGRRVRHAFVVAELALAVMLLSGAGLMVQSFVRLRSVDAGFDTSRMLTMRLSLPREKYARERVAPFYEDLSARLGGVPGVRVAGAATQYPPGNVFSTRVGLEGERSAGDGAFRTADITVATTGFFPAMGYPLRSGRVFGTQDVETSPRVVVLNETAARRFFPQGNFIGQRLRLGDETSTELVEVVGVVGDVRNRGLDAPTAPELFVPVRQAVSGWNNQLFLMIRTTVPPMSVLGPVRAAIASVDPDQPAYAIASLDDSFAASMGQRRIAMVLLTIFAGVALVLAAVGVYGIMSYMVTERTHEIGIRVALGARRGHVLGMIMRQTVALVALGLTLGVAGALALGGAVSGLVFGVRASDPPTLALVAVVLAAAALIACYIPARRAATVSPLEAMRG